MPDPPQRRSIRLAEFDYAQAGAYFVTICVQDRECLFGDVEEGQMIHNRIGREVQLLWESLPSRFPSVVLDAFVVMPNHVHGIIILRDAASGSAGAASSAPTG